MKPRIVVFAMLAIATLFHTRPQRRQQQPDEHSQWLGADAGGSFIHHGSVSE